MDNNGVGPKRVKTALPSEIGLRGLKVSNIWLIIMSNTFKDPKNPNLVDIYWVKLQLDQKRADYALPSKIGLRGV